VHHRLEFAGLNPDHTGLFLRIPPHRAIRRELALDPVACPVDVRGGARCGRRVAAVVVAAGLTAAVVAGLVAVVVGLIAVVVPAGLVATVAAGLTATEAAGFTATVAVGLAAVTVAGARTTGAGAARTTGAGAARTTGAGAGRAGAELVLFLSSASAGNDNYGAVSSKPTGASSL
jgi:hypothetical protein